MGSQKDFGIFISVILAGIEFRSQIALLLPKY